MVVWYNLNLNFFLNCSHLWRNFSLNQKECIIVIIYCYNYLFICFAILLFHYFPYYYFQYFLNSSFIGVFNSPQVFLRHR